MQINYKDQIITIPSMNSDEQNHTEFLFLQSCGILSELQLQQLTSKQKKELLSLSEDKESGIENGIESITQIHDTINTFELIQQILIDKLQRKLTRVAKKLLTFETYQNETKRNELENEIIETDSIEIPNLNDEEINQLEEWTNKKCEEVIFDSDIDGYPTMGSTTFTDRINGKGMLIFLIEDEKGQKFGGYINAIIDTKKYTTDYDSFIFFLKSNEFDGMNKFEMNPNWASNAFNTCWHIPSWLFGFGGNGGHTIFVHREGEKSQSGLYHDVNRYNYHGIIPENKNSTIHFIPKRIVVIQMN